MAAEVFLKSEVLLWGWKLVSSSRGSLEKSENNSSRWRCPHSLWRQVLLTSMRHRSTSMASTSVDVLDVLAVNFVLALSLGWVSMHLSSSRGSLEKSENNSSRWRCPHSLWRQVLLTSMRHRSTSMASTSVDVLDVLAVNFVLALSLGWVSMHLVPRLDFNASTFAVRTPLDTTALL